MCGTGYKNTVLKERTEQGEGFGHVSDIVGDVSEDTAVFDVELVDNSHDFGCHHFVIYLVQVDLIAEVGDYFRLVKFYNVWSSFITFGQVL